MQSTEIFEKGVQMVQMVKNGRFGSFLAFHHKILAERIRCTGSWGLENPQLYCPLCRWQRSGSSPTSAQEADGQGGVEVSLDGGCAADSSGAGQIVHATVHPSAMALPGVINPPPPRLCTPILQKQQGEDSLVGLGERWVGLGH